MLVMYYFGPGTHHIGIMAAKLPFDNFDQKNCPSFSEPIFFESAKRAALFDSESAKRAALVILSESAKRAALLILGKSASGAPIK
mgnify:CR=1 FL=1